ncbi:hypothetical protein D3C87_351270 [compost metagenome]
MSRYSISDEQQAANLRLTEIIRPISSAAWSSTYNFRNLESGLKSLAEDYGVLELNPDFQRGHVWTEEQQVRFIEASIRGLIPSACQVIQFNCPNWHHNNTGILPDGFQCMDGLQRYTAINRFIKGEIRPFGLDVEDFYKTSFSPRDINVTIAVHCYTNKNELLRRYIDINTGGTPHHIDEISRVRAMITD